MVRDFLLGIAMMFLVEPFAADMDRMLATARAPEALMREVAACTGTAAPALIDRALADWGWAASAAIRVTTGLASAEALIVETVPSCAGAIAEARRLLDGAEA